MYRSQKINKCVQDNELFVQLIDKDAGIVCQPSSKGEEIKVH